MAFWALGALDKMKNITGSLNIKNVSKKVISYVVIFILFRPLRMRQDRIHKIIRRICSTLKNKKIYLISSQRRYCLRKKGWKSS